MNVDLKRNPKQEQYFNTAIESAYGLNDFRDLNYGGAIRGGKTFVSLAILAALAKQFKGFKSHVVRADFPALQATAIPSMEKILKGSFNWKWNRDRANYFVYHQKSDGKIFFRGENKSQDPELLDFLGLETNAFLFEQIEEIDEMTYEIAGSRNGSWYIDPMPKPLRMATFNPTQTWIKERVFEKWQQGNLDPSVFFMHALPSDNAFVTDEQWKLWGNMADRYQKQFIAGDWTDFSSKDNLWAFAFDNKKHVGKVEYKKDQVTYLAFDFNRNPICCSVVQWYNKCIWVVETIKLPNSDIYKLCDHILVKYPRASFVVTGDASGSSSNALVQDNINYYTVIKLKLGLTSSQIKVPSVNPRLEDNQVLFNSVISHYPFVADKDNAKAFIFDCNNVKMLPAGQIDKADRKDEKKQADALDTVRYWINVFMWDFLKKI